MVEGAGGPSWYTEYNVLTGLSARSYGRFADFVTRIAAGPRRARTAARAAPLRLQDLHVLSDVRCVPERAAFPDRRPAFRTFSTPRRSKRELPRSGLVLSSTRRPTCVAKQRGKDPLFMLVYTAQNHFPVGLPLPSRPRARVARSSATAPTSTSTCAASISARSTIRPSLSG